MAGSLLEYSNNIYLFADSLNGYNNITFNNFSSDSEIKVSAGSKIHVNGNIYTFTNDETINGWSAVTTGQFVYVVTNGTADTISLEYSTEEPTWYPEQNGYYDSSYKKRYIGGLYKESSTSYNFKYKNNFRKEFDSGKDNIYSLVNTNVINYKGFSINDYSKIDNLSDFTTYTIYYAKFFDMVNSNEDTTYYKYYLNGLFKFTLGSASYSSNSVGKIFYMESYGNDMYYYGISISNVAGVLSRVATFGINDLPESTGFYYF